MSGNNEYNPFVLETEKVDVNPFEEGDNEEFTEVNGNGFHDMPPVLQVEGRNHINGVATYTSLEPQHLESIVNSDEDIDDNIIQMSNLSKPLSDEVDLYVKVDSPEKHVEGYVSYNVITQTTRSEFESTEYKVRRRYQDFLWLREKLEESHPSHIIPPLPEKFTFTKHITYKYDQDFLKTRQKALDKFVARIVDHPVISFNDHFKTFLTAEAWEMTTARKEVTNPVAKMGGQVRNTATQLMMKNRDDEFTNMIQYNNQLQAKFKSLSTIGDTIAQERCYMLEDYAEYATAFRLWANSETKLAETLNAVSQGIDNQSKNLKLLLRAHELRICEPLREYALYCDAVRLSLKKRDQIQIQHELSSEELQKRRQEKEELESGAQMKSIQALFGKDPEELRREKIDKLSQQIADLVRETDILSDNRATADQDIRADMERWQANKKRDLKALFLEIAERHIKYYQGNVEAWQDALEVVKKPHKVIE